MQVDYKFCADLEHVEDWLRETGLRPGDPAGRHPCRRDQGPRLGQDSAHGEGDAIECVREKQVQGRGTVGR